MYIWPCLVLGACEWEGADLVMIGAETVQLVEPEATTTRQYLLVVKDV